MNGARPTHEEVIDLSLQASLDEAGFAVQLFSEATNALASIDHITIVAAIIDVGLPALPIILATGYDEGRYASSMAADPLFAVLEKPFDTPRLALGAAPLCSVVTICCDLDSQRRAGKSALSASL